jgi:hypothetical protein
MGVFDAVETYGAVGTYGENLVKSEVKFYLFYTFIKKWKNFFEFMEEAKATVMVEPRQ